MFQDQEAYSVSPAVFRDLAPHPDESPERVVLAQPLSGPLGAASVARCSEPLCNRRMAAAAIEARRRASTPAKLWAVLCDSHNGS